MTIHGWFTPKKKFYECGAFAHMEIINFHPEAEKIAAVINGGIYEGLFKHGFIRIEQIGDSIHFEGNPHYLKERYKLCVDFAEEYGCIPKFDKS